MSFYQRVSFAYGQCAMGNPDLTYGQVLALALSGGMAAMSSVMQGVRDALLWEVQAPGCPRMNCTDDEGHDGPHRDHEGGLWIG